MGLRKILTDKEPALHKTCRPVTEFDAKLHKLLDDMRETLIESGGVGLAAPQVGILRRVFLVDVGAEENDVLSSENSNENVGAEGGDVLGATLTYNDLFYKIYSHNSFHHTFFQFVLLLQLLLHQKFLLNQFSYM